MTFPAGALQMGTAMYGANLTRRGLQLAAAGNPVQDSSSNSESGTYFTPWQEAIAQKQADQYGRMLDIQGNLMTSLGNRLTNWPTGGTGGTGTGGTPTTTPLSFGGQLDFGATSPGDASDFATYFGNISGGMPGAQFTDIPVEDVITPQMLQEQMNNLFSNEQAKAGPGVLGLFNARPGMTATPYRVGENAALMEAGTRAGIAREYANKIPSLMFQNQDQKLQSRVAQTNVENARLNAALQQASLAGTWRGQDIQNSLGRGGLQLQQQLGLGRLNLDQLLGQGGLALQRDLGMGRLDVDREGNLLRALSSFGSGFGGGGGGGFLTPLQYSTSSSTSSSRPAY